jgi:hypothetical protein
LIVVADTSGLPFSLKCILQTLHKIKILIEEKEASLVSGKYLPSRILHGYLPHKMFTNSLVPPID